MKTRRPRHIGTWVLYADVAGQVSCSPQNPIVTVAVVGIPPELVPTVRTRLRHQFTGAPVKLKRGGHKGLQHVLDLIVASRVSVTVSQVHCADPARWRRYYHQATDFADEAKRRGESKPYLSGDTVLRIRLIGGAMATCVGRLLRGRVEPWTDAPVRMSLDIVTDTDLPDNGSRETFCEWLAYWGRASAPITAAGVTKEVTARSATEQEEPLLLLPDYLAGLYHHADPRAKLTVPVISPMDASQAEPKVPRAPMAEIRMGGMATMNTRAISMLQGRLARHVRKARELRQAIRALRGWQRVFRRAALKGRTS